MVFHDLLPLPSRILTFVSFINSRALAADAPVCLGPGNSPRFLKYILGYDSPFLEKKETKLCKGFFLAASLCLFCFLSQFFFAARGYAVGSKDSILSGLVVNHFRFLPTGTSLLL